MVKAAAIWLGLLSTQEAGAPNRDDSSQAQNRKIWRDVQTVSDGLDSTNIKVPSLAHTRDWPSRCVRIAGCGRRARSAAMRGYRVSGGRQVRHSDWVILEFGRLATVSGRSLTYATVYRPPPDCTEAGGIPCRPVLEGLSGPFVLVGHSYSGVPVTEVAAAREDVTHVVYVCAFAMPAGTSMLDVLGGQPREW